LKDKQSDEMNTCSC